MDKRKYRKLLVEALDPLDRTQEYWEKGQEALHASEKRAAAVRQDLLLSEGVEAQGPVHKATCSDLTSRDKARMCAEISGWLWDDLFPKPVKLVN